MEQKRIISEKEATALKLSWVDMVDFNVQVDYDAVIFPVDDDDTSELHLTEPEERMSDSDHQGETTPSTGLEVSPSVETQQVTPASAESEVSPSVETQQVTPASSREWTQTSPRRTRGNRDASAFKRNRRSFYVEQATERINSLMQQVDNLKKQLHVKTCDLHEEREQRITIQVECTSYLEKIREMEEALGNERDVKVLSEQKEEEQESVAPDMEAKSRFKKVPKVTVNVDVLKELNFLRRQAESHNLKSKKLAEALVEERQLRLKCEDKLKTYRELESKFQQQEQKITCMQSHIVNLTLELNLALKEKEHRDSSQNNSFKQAEVSAPSRTSASAEVSATSEASTAPSEDSTRTRESVLTGRRANTPIRDISVSCHYVRRYGNRGVRAKPGLQSNTGHRPGADVNASRRGRPHRAPQGKPHLNTHAGFGSNPGLDANQSPYPAQGLDAKPRCYPDPGPYQRPF